MRQNARKATSSKNSSKGLIPRRHGVSVGTDNPHVDNGKSTVRYCKEPKKDMQLM
jgi:hypothetical protein